MQDVKFKIISDVVNDATVSPQTSRMSLALPRSPDNSHRKGRERKGRGLKSAQSLTAQVTRGTSKNRIQAGRILEEECKIGRMRAHRNW